MKYIYTKCLNSVGNLAINIALKYPQIFPKGLILTWGAKVRMCNNIAVSILCDRESFH